MLWQGRGRSGIVLVYRGESGSIHLKILLKPSTLGLLAPEDDVKKFASPEALNV